MSEDTPLLDNNGTAGQTQASHATRYPKRAQSEHHRYHSSAIHLPQDLLFQPPNNDPSTSLFSPFTFMYQSDPNSEATALNIGDEKPSPTDDSECATTTKPHLSACKKCVFWSNVSLFAVGLVLGVVGIALSPDSVFYALFAVMIACCLSALLLTQIHRSLLLKAVSLRAKLWTWSHPELAYDDTVQSKQVSLFESFRRGDFHKQLGVCAGQELKQLLPVVLSHSIVPFLIIIIICP